jgi:RNA polymerase sigma factor (sigma-70 family)
VIDEAEIERFVREDYSRLVNAVALVAGDLSTAEDLVQEALARALDRPGQHIEELANWVAAVALNLSRSRWRRLAVERRVRRLDERDDIREPTTVVDARLDVERALEGLPRRQREVAVLRYLLGMSTREAASILGVGEGTVKNSLSKARIALAARLGISDVERVDDAADR